MSIRRIRKGGRLLSAVAVLLGGIAGCITAHSDDEHLEHHLPEHKPPSYSAAVDQVRQRHLKIRANFTTAEIAPLKRDLSEMIDIIGWLPELAADSSMTRQPWDKACEAARQLSVIYRDATIASTASPRTKWPDDERIVDGLMQTLAEQIPSDDMN